MRIGAHSWIVIDGRSWHGIVLFGHARNGIRLYPESSHITLRHVEVYDNGSALRDNGAWAPDGAGVDFAGTHISFERCIVHDNGQDAFQSGGGVAGFVLRQSWLYNGRENPTRDGEPFNYCAHPDGIQVFAGGPQSRFVVEQSILGPGLMQGVLLGQSSTPDGHEAVIHDVMLTDVVFSKAGGNDIMGYPHTKPERWVIEHVTVHARDRGYCLYLEGSGHTIVDSIFHSGRIELPDGLDYSSGNFQWNTRGYHLGQIGDPRFLQADGEAPFSLDNYALAPDSPCLGKGSRLTSVAQLLALKDATVHSAQTAGAD
jgi:hypothetical protein